MSINVNDKNLGHATAYGYYKAGGGTMTEAEFTEFMADFGTASQTAVEAAQAALASETAATTAATTATNKASEATTAAQTATTKAGEASTNASTATSAKDTAVSASQTATSKASEAAQSATSANTAKVDAVAAKTAAETAQGKAEDAQAAAEAVAESIPSDYSQLSEDVSDIKENLIQNGFYIITGWINGEYLKCNVIGDVVNINSPYSASAYKYVLLSCNEGDKFTVSGTGGGNPRLWAFLDVDYKVINNAGNDATANKLALIAPVNAKYLIINDNTNSDSYYGHTSEQLVDSENATMIGRTKNIVDSKLVIGKSDYYTGRWYYTTVEVTNAANVNIVSQGDTLHTDWSNYRISYVELNNDYTVKEWHTINKDTRIATGVIYRFNVVQISGDATTQAEIDAMIAATYVFTDAGAVDDAVIKNQKRLNTIENKLTDEFLPDYAEKAVKRIIGQLKAMSPDGNLLVFGFNTDQHISYPRDNMPKNVKPVLTGLAALKKITQGYPTDFVCLGGDGVVSSETDIAHILDSCVTIQTPLQGSSCPIVPITGNHDAVQNNANITGAMLFNSHFKRVANSGFLVGWDNTHTNGYWESKSHKCRVIFLDDTLRTDYTTTDRSDALTDMLADVPNDYRILIISHHPISSDLIDSGWQNPLGLQNIIQPYASQIICCICGHSHKDLSETSDGILYIGTTMAAYGNDADGNTRTLNTEDETAYDVFCIDADNNIYAFRYGYGSDRSWTNE